MEATPEQTAAIKQAWDDLCRRREAGVVLPGVSSEELRERARLVRQQRSALSIIDRIECEMNGAHDWGPPVFRDDNNESKRTIRWPDDLTFLDWECRRCGTALLDEEQCDELNGEVRDAAQELPLAEQRNHEHRGQVRVRGGGASVLSDATAQTPPAWQRLGMAVPAVQTMV